MTKTNLQPFVAEKLESIAKGAVSSFNLLLLSLNPDIVRPDNSSHGSIIDNAVSQAALYQGRLHQAVKCYSGIESYVGLPRFGQISKKLHRYIALDTIVNTVLETIHIEKALAIDYTEYAKSARDIAIHSMFPGPLETIGQDDINNIILNKSYESIGSIIKVLTIDKDYEMIKVATEYLLQNFPAKTTILPE